MTIYIFQLQRDMEQEPAWMAGMRSVGCNYGLEVFFMQN